MNTARVACVTCRSIPEPDPDEDLLLEALRERGLDPSLAAWDGDVDWAGYDLCVLRSTWNYYLDRPAFLAWIRRADEVTTLLNPPAVLEANTDKRYLRALAAAGVPVVPTEVVEPADALTLEAIRARRGWGEVVIKPCVGAASYGARRFGPGEGEAHLAAVAEAGGALVQPFLAGVEQPGEHAVVWIDGAITHAVRKSPRFAGGVEAVTDRAVPVPEGAAELARRALATVDADLLYARVDVVAHEGELAIMELELTEPSLFLRQHEPALARLADAIARLTR